MAGNPHGPNRITNYIQTHDTVMGQFVDGRFVQEDTLVFVSHGAGRIVLSGSLQCLGGIRLDVFKTLQVIDGSGSTARVQTTDYSYNASLDGVGNILRYDSPHPDHNRFHHVHRFNVFDGDRGGRVEKTEWPTLGNVLGEVQDWFYENYTRIDGLRRL